MRRPRKSGIYNMGPVREVETTRHKLSRLTYPVTHFKRIPNIKINYINANTDVDFMIRRSIATAAKH